MLEMWYWGRYPCFVGQGVWKSMNTQMLWSHFMTYLEDKMVTYPRTNNDLKFQSHAIEIESFNYRHWISRLRKHITISQNISVEKSQIQGVASSPLAVNVCRNSLVVIGLWWWHTMPHWSTSSEFRYTCLTEARRLSPPLNAFIIGLRMTS